MSNTLKHKDPLPGALPDTGDATKCGPDVWREEHVFSGGSTGQVLIRDSAQSDGAKWQTKAVFDVRDYGAIGNGVADDTTAIQAAIAAATSGGRVFFPAGTYRFTPSRTFSNLSYVCFCGVGRDSVLTPTVAGHGWILDATCTDLVVEDLSFVGLSVANEGYAAVQLRAPRSRVERCFFSGFNQGLTINDVVANDCTVSRCTFSALVGNQSGNGYGIYNIGQRTIIAHNHFLNVPRHDVYLSNASPQGSLNCVVIGNTSTGNGVEAIALFGGSADPAVRGCVVTGNLIVNAVGIGIGVDSNATDNVIVGNIIDTPTSFGIYLNGGVVANSYPVGNTVTGNLIRNPATNAINCINASYTLVAANNIRGESGAVNRGISVSFTGSPSTVPTKTKVTANQFFNCTTTVFIDTNSDGTPCGQLVDEAYTGWVSFPDGATTPDVSQGTNFVCNYTNPATITNFLGGVDAKEITILFNGAAVTVTQANAFLQGGVNFSSGSGTYPILRLKWRVNNWFETGRTLH